MDSFQIPLTLLCLLITELNQYRYTQTLEFMVYSNFLCFRIFFCSKVAPTQEDTVHCLFASHACLGQVFKHFPCDFKSSGRPGCALGGTSCIGGWGHPIMLWLSFNLCCQLWLSCVFITILFLITGGQTRRLERVGVKLLPFYLCEIGIWWNHFHWRVIRYHGEHTQNISKQFSSWQKHKVIFLGSYHEHILASFQLKFMKVWGLHENCSSQAFFAASLMYSQLPTASPITMEVCLYDYVSRSFCSR